MSILPVLFVLAPLAIYLMVALRKGKDTITGEEFFESRGLISPSEFANSSIAYGFQIASVSVFFAWGFIYGLGAIVNPLFWGFGIILFMVVCGRLGDFFGTTQTLHGFLGSRYNSRAIAVIASVMTLIGFLGAFTAELAWGSYVFAIISPNPWFIGISMTVMAAIVAWYVTRAGHLSVVKTDQYQLVFAHAAFVVLVVFVITLLHWQDAEAKAIGFILSVATAVMLALVAFSIIRQLRDKRERGAPDLGHAISLVILSIMVLGGIASIVNAVIFSSSLDAMSTAVADSRLYDFNQGALNLASLALLPLCWHFADVTMWQRLGATRLPPRDHPNRYAAIKKGLLRYAIESPITWMLAIVAGIALRYANIGLTDESIWNGLAEIPAAILAAETPAGPFVQYLVASLFAAGIVAAMLSTADSFLIGSTFTLAYDLAPKVADGDGDIIAANPQRALRLGRIASVVFIVAGLASYWIATALGFDILSILFGAFAAQVSLFPAVFGTIILRDRAPSGGWAVASVIAGFVAAGAALGIALSDTSWAMYPPLFALGASVPIYIVGAIVGKPKAPNGPPNGKKLNKDQLLFLICLGSLLLTLFLAVSDAVLRVLGKHVWIVGDGDEFWLVWELAAIAGAIAGTATYWMGQYWMDPPISKFLNRAPLVGTMPYIVLATLAAFLGAAFVAFSHWHILWQLGCLCAGVSGFVLIQSLFLWDTANPLKQQTRAPAGLGRARKDLREALVYSDLPALIAFFTLLLIVSLLLLQGDGETEKMLRPFVGGVVAFQLVTTNVVFVIAYWHTPPGLESRFPRFVNWFERLLK